MTRGEQLDDLEPDEHEHAVVAGSADPMRRLAQLQLDSIAGDVSATLELERLRAGGRGGVYLGPSWLAWMRPGGRQ